MEHAAPAVRGTERLELPGQAVLERRFTCYRWGVLVVVEGARGSTPPATGWYRGLRLRDRNQPRLGQLPRNPE
jgi:hypothetical protein